VGHKNYLAHRNRRDSTYIMIRNFTGNGFTQVGPQDWQHNRTQEFKTLYKFYGNMTASVRDAMVSIIEYILLFTLFLLFSNLYLPFKQKLQFFDCQNPSLEKVEKAFEFQSICFTSECWSQSVVGQQIMAYRPRIGNPFL
jgi:hypothetical protein